MKLSEKDMGSILYMYYMNNYCENMFSFDKGETLAKVKSHYNKLVEKYGEKEIQQIEDKIHKRDEEGTDYDAMYFSHDMFPGLDFQITSMIDYDGKSPDGYNDSDSWCDVGMFLIDYNAVDFDNLKDSDNEKE